LFGTDTAVSAQAKTAKPQADAAKKLRIKGYHRPYTRSGRPCGVRRYFRETLLYFFEKQKDGFFATLRMTKA
jgi:hypothetical protein